MGTLSIGAGATLTINSGGGDLGTSVVKSMPALGAGARFDPADNDLVIDYTGSSPVADVQAAIATARNGGAWDGFGITSSAAASHPAQATTLGVMEALDYITSHSWCPPQKDMFLACGVGGVIALFLVEFTEKIAGSPDDALWLVVGDLPSAYFVTENATHPRAALETYCNLMDDWVAAVLDGGDLDEVYPVEAEPSEQNEQELASRLRYLRAEVIPAIS